MARALPIGTNIRKEHELILSWHLRNGGRREENKGGAARTASPRGVLLLDLHCEEMITADWVGVRVPTVAVMSSSGSIAGAVTVPTVVLARWVIRVTQ